MFSYFNSGFGYWFLALWVVFLTVLIGWLSHPLRPSLGRLITKNVKLLAHRQWVAMGTLFVIVFGANLLLTCIRYPQPEIHDEFAYQLAADTYASGRLTNSTHPFWQHFETFHVLSEPSYMAKYPPGTGLVLGMGQKLTGHSLVGFWLTLAAGVAALYWMLKAWLPVRWCFTGCLLIAVNPYWLTNWGQTWWGGAVALLAGALLFGSMKRLVDGWRHLTFRNVFLYSSIFSVGASLLAISRPFEGFIACVICGFLLARAVVLHWGRVALPMIFALVLPALLIGTTAIILIGCNNKAVTGDYTTLPYSLHSSRYSASPMWVFQKAAPIPEYRLQRMEDFYVKCSRAFYERAQSPRGYIEQVSIKLKQSLDFYPLFGGLCLLPIVVMRFREQRWLNFCVLVIGGIVGMHLLTNFSSVYPHYVAPFAGLFYVMALHGLRCWRVVSRQYEIAACVLPAVVCWSVVQFVFLIVFTVCQIGTDTPRASIERELTKVSGTHLVFVRYPKDYSPLKEWVYNRADIDGSKIVWAHSLGESEDQKLLQYFKDQGRQVWHWDVGTKLERTNLNADSH